MHIKTKHCTVQSITHCAKNKTMAIVFITTHIVPCGKIHRIGGAPPESFHNVKYDAPEEVGGDRKCLDSPIRK